MTTTGIDSRSFTQASPSTAWVIDHNFGFPPVFNVIISYNGVDTAMQPGSAVHETANRLVIHFSEAYSGRALLYGGLGAPAPRAIVAPQVPLTPLVDPTHNAILYLRASGSDGSTSIPDTSANALQVVAESGVTLTTAQYYVAPSSINFPLNSTSGVRIKQYVNATSTSRINPGDGADFTMELFARLTDNAGNRFVWSLGGVSGSSYPAMLLGTAANTSTLYVQTFSNSFTGGLLVNMSTTVGLTLNTWHHIAVTRSGNLWTLWLDGVDVVHQTINGTPFTSAEDLMLGKYDGIPPTVTWVGQMGPVRWTHGEALYTAPFDVSTAVHIT